jgi:hypothetical protein
MIVPTLCVGMQPGTLGVPSYGVTQSVTGGIPTRSMGTISVTAFSSPSRSFIVSPSTL